MVLICAYPGCFSRLKTKRLRSLAQTHSGVVTFHVFPIYEPYRLELWLIALRMDLNTPIKKLKLLRVCSDHFSPDDFRYTVEDNIRLKPSAVPMGFPNSSKTTKEEPDQPAEHESDMGQETKLLGTDIGLKDVPQSTPLKLIKSDVENTTGQEDKLNKHMVLLTSPQSEHSYSSTSGTYALPAVSCQQFEEPAAIKSEPDDIIVSVLSLDPPSDDKKDVSFLPPSSTFASSTTTKTEEEEEEKPWQERNWIVNESALMKQFRRCQDCGALIPEKKITTLGICISIHWECEQGHKGEWSSCTDVRGIPSNNLLVQGISNGAP